MAKASFVVYSSVWICFVSTAQLIDTSKKRTNYVTCITVKESLTFLTSYLQTDYQLICHKGLNNFGINSIFF